MNRLASLCLALGLSAGWAGSLAAADAAPATPAGEDVPAATPIGSGPQRAIMETDAGLPTHTLYHPQDLGGAARLPLVIWGNGACANVGNSFRWFLSDIASYGYFVIAIGPIVPNARRMPVSMVPVTPSPATPAAAAQLPPPASHSAQLIDAMNWAFAENDRKESRYYQRFDTRKVAVMGMSCGGAQAIEASADPRVTSTVIWSSGLFPQPTAMGGGKALTREDLKRLHAPVAYISGDEEDIAFENANGDFDALEHVPVLRAYSRGVLHGGTYAERNGGEFAGIAVGWLNWQLKGDRRAARLFVGTDCGLCVNPHWVVRSKHLQ